MYSCVFQTQLLGAPSLDLALIFSSPRLREALMFPMSR